MTTDSIIKLLLSNDSLSDLKIYVQMYIDRMTQIVVVISNYIKWHTNEIKKKTHINMYTTEHTCILPTTKYIYT